MSDLVDWALAERVAIRTASRRPGPAWDRDAVTRAARDAANVAEPLVESWTGLRAPGAARVEVVGRAEWASINVRGFARLLEPVAAAWAERLQRQRRTSARTLSVTGRVAAVELGTMLGWLSGRVLGQYDLLLAGDAATGAGLEPTGDTVYLVGPNLVGLESHFGFPPDQFRLWVVLHELTHRAQFTGVPWMHGHYLSLVRGALSAADVDPGHAVRAVRAAVDDPATARARLQEGGLAALFATPEQQPLLQHISGLMALLEGHGEHTMNRAGPDLVPAVDRFHRVIAARREQTSPVARRLQRLIGLEAKLAQYAQGLRFVETLTDAGGRAAVDRCWAAPDNLPTLEEIRHPERWLARTEDVPAVA